MVSQKIKKEALKQLPNEFIKVRQNFIKSLWRNELEKIYNYTDCFDNTE